MVKTVEEVVTTKIVYTANDGTRFSDKLKCLHHEWAVNATTVYAVHARGTRASQTEIYSTLELANKAVGDSDIYSITPIRVDERFWDDNSESLLTKARAFFINKEGYPASDSTCIEYYKEYGPKD